MKDILCSAVLAHFMLNEKLHIFGVLGCILCVVGSVSIVLHAPREKDIESVKDIWNLATEPGYPCMLTKMFQLTISSKCLRNHISCPLTNIFHL